MGLIAEVLQFLRGEDGDAKVSEAKGDLGGNDVFTAVNYQPAGFDAFPLTTDYMLVVPGPEAGTFLVAGYLDPVNAGTAREGEVSLYLRDADGAVQGELCLASEEPDWKAEAGALIARADRVDAELEKLKTAHNEHTHKHDVCGGGDSAVTPDGGTSASPNKTYSRESTAAEKGWVT